jgi:hypothetical protein
MVANGVSQAAAGPPKCRPGSAPVLDTSGWTCLEGRYWPTVENQNGATAPLKLDCAPGTSRIRIGPIEFEDSACLPPKPRCARGSQADPNPALPKGCNCLFPPDCPRGTHAELTPGQGYNCLPLERSLGCPPHTASGNYGAGVPGLFSERPNNLQTATRLGMERTVTGHSAKFSSLLAARKFS